ncbi:signal peptidase I [Hymenobacter glacialis]|uniref:Signal peptidase I n=1 Tax=Hymenobacter glacialis TaxID=1908236 RepID=A0A1G1SUK4_9BACT|nr:signal peptidase I [Hymenobacter glacialis]OGX82288.1 S26 family signal peptidase [Hymenobacter glacialis]
MSLLKTNRPAAPQAPKTKTREWADSLIFAIVAATLIRWATFEAYTIPSPSMENSLLVGDYLFVSKLHYGPITPQTPLQVPLTHQTVWGTALKSYSELIQLPTYRLPGFSEIKRNDVVVFHVPHESQYPADLRTNYIKRCVAVAGDTLEIREGKVYLNGKPGETPPGLETTYFMQVDNPNDEVVAALRAQGVVDYDQPGGSPQAVPGPDGKLGYAISGTVAAADYFRKQPYVKSMTVLQPPVLLFPDVADFRNSGAMSATPRGWSLDNYGPLPIPKKGQTIALTPGNAAIYFKIVARYERNQGITWKDGMIYQNGKMLTSYTIKQNYYMMMGDNRHNSEDSRFWGFVPEDHVVGKAVLIWLSVDPNAGFWNKIRWSRLFNIIH